MYANVPSPDVLLGSLDFGADMDLWSLGCVTAELHLREPLFGRQADKANGHNLILEQCELLGAPANNSTMRA